MAFKTYLLRRIILQVIIVLFLICGTCFGQRPPEVEHYDKGIKYAIQGKSQEAETEFKQALKFNANYAPATTCLELITDANNYKIDKDSFIRIFKGRYYGDRRMWDEAITEFTVVITRQMDFARVYIGRGLAYKNKGDNDKAISDFTKSIEINPRIASAYLKRGSLYAGKSMHNQAISDFDKTIKIQPNLVLSYFMKAEVCEKINHKEEAIKNYRLFLTNASSENAVDKPYIKQAKERISELEK
jgi:tetratricopeptide (TPR) repeat protein